MKHTIGPIEKLGTTWWFELFGISEDVLPYIEAELRSEMDEFEKRYSRFRSDSMLSKLNDNRVLDNPDAEFVHLCKIALEAYQVSGGVFNAAVGSLLEKRGYDAEYSFASSTGIDEEMPKLDDSLVVEDNQILLWGAGKLDFGGFGKGYLIDKLAAVLENELGVRYYLINGGGDMYASCDEDNKPIIISMQHPQDAQKQVGQARLYYQAFAASSPHVRTWHDQHGEKQHHLVGFSQQPGSSFVIAPSATWADIYATILSIDPDFIPPQNVWSHCL